MERPFPPPPFKGTSSNESESNGATSHDPADLIVRTRDLTKRYGNFLALDRCNLEVRAGEIFGLLGPNGAGKSTLIRLLLGYLHVTSGSCEVVGKNPEIDSVAVRRGVAYLPGDARLPRHMRGDGLLKFFAQMHPLGDLKRSLEVAERLELDLSRRVAFMSTGMRQKLALAVVFGPRTPLLILDEPTANLDPTVRGEVLNLVLTQRDEGRTVMFSSHVLSEIEQTCDRVAFLRRGELVRRLTMQELFQRHRVTAVLNDEETDGSDTDEPLGKIPEILADRIERVSIVGRQVRIDTAGDLGPALSWLASLPVHQVRIEPLGLHTVYQSVHRAVPVAEATGPYDSPDVTSDQMGEVS
ncbi:ABC transporter ATP-binding protein [Neorhodopirellula pilleata]|uniref:Putative ABC transporter ATP-binding protein YbhF n=1 Tax=Neorhodopirellula pilleata TaxID=2714738 RepID=A0A5C6AE40_9BACT|nr:ABC transporter ATP-binding protein [Neorhodopirellula pilleata]TWT96503.1 putative ABC transporter ATP-binding protein YbhF [Neorhodopirellula pilleata]